MQIVENSYGLADIRCGIYPDVSVSDKGLRTAPRDWTTFDDVVDYPRRHPELCLACDLRPICALSNKVPFE